MKKKIISMAMCILMVLSLMACGEQNKDESVNASNTDEIINTEVETETDTDKSEVNPADVTDNVPKQDVDLNLTEYQYSFEDRTIELTGTPVLNESDFEDLYEIVTFTDSVDLYIDADIYIGYTKPNISVSLMSKCGDWYMVSVGDKVRYAKVDEVDALKEAKKQEEDFVPVKPPTPDSAPTSENTSTVSPATTTPETQQTDVASTDDSAEVVQAGDKYTPEEAISVYRGLMEAGGITWDPSLKGVTSWGTGWIYLDKGQPEWAASTDLESFAMGDSGGRSWTKYYLEVTGSDDECVYITEWHSN